MTTPKIHRPSGTAGGDTLIVESGGVIEVKSGGLLNLTAATGSVTFAAGEIAAVDLAAASLAGTQAAVVANANVIGGLPVLHRIDVADASADTDVVLTHKTRVIDAWGLNTGIAAHATTDTWQLKNGATAITNAVAKTDAVNAVKRIGTIDPAQAEIAAAGTLRITAAKTTNAAVTVYVLGIRVA